MNPMKCLIVTASTFAVLTYAGIDPCGQPMETRLEATHNSVMSHSHPWDAQLTLTRYYGIDPSTSSDLQKVNIIRQFASELISNSVELESSFADMVTRRYWDLI